MKANGRATRGKIIMQAVGEGWVRNKAEEKDGWGNFYLFIYFLRMKREWERKWIRGRECREKAERIEKSMEKSMFKRNESI